MSKENVEIVERLFKGFRAAMKRGDPATGLDPGSFAEDFEWIVPTPLDGRSVWHGREGFIDFTRLWTEQFEHWSVWIERVIDAGEDRVVVLTRQSATGKESGVPVELSLGQVWELETGRVTRIRNYFGQAEALEAAGLSE
jgi:ketosteroid isomerase-like protein